MKLGINSISFWFGSIMIVLVIAGAMVILFTDAMSERLYGNKRIFFVILLMAYAVYRGFRLYSFLKQNKEDAG